MMQKVYTLPYLFYFRGMFKPPLFIFFFLFLCNALQAQTVAQQLANKIKLMQNSPQLEHGIVSLCVADAATGDILYSTNEQMGLMPASNMKVFTSVAALDLLGADYRFKTEIGYSGNIQDSTLYGNLFIVGHGDPTTGSWRYSQTKPDSIMSQIGNILRNAGISNIMGDIILDGSKFSFNPVPGGWSWDDLGSYYGAGNWGLNWHENQYDLVLKPTRTGDTVGIKSMAPEVPYASFVNELKTAAAGTGDNSYPYLPPYGDIAVIEGTVPAGGLFTVSGSLPEPFTPIAAALKQFFIDHNIVHTGTIQSSMDYTLSQKSLPHYNALIGTLYSPTLDSIIYWFMKKSINMYGEDLIKTMAMEKYGVGTTDSGVAILRTYWQERGIEKSAFRITDGSGLSAQNHVTTHGLVQALLYAKTRPWYAAFYNSLPIYNGMHMKSGTIGGVKSFSGYHTSARGKQYVFSIIVNNYDGSTDAIVNKMYSVLNELKK
ncbi:D-alanyl-D-alanine carboxypeptidase/D-alanyl-D-alanine-endopeptidase [Ilyomonas limi]|uniref:D-alanyl-D-alanine carboxypeptidase/D-alanyl-D-alanine-endopeptidase n=1 Tax=Ilyomonas limi TaxID=2575867 RepID=A0A4U3L1X5_9BACT|nr:D-alanyl-D-alanine carboxypeptidase/D-alanyl-D-alanine-endopeptidase [Ilyomonas limi]TKK69008.1 D-alanyl-D-alanine carboxypeptidase/D-alanyl-D-alanine-endopeptidase [Ilyomonas limi]